jgi:hypothetical protein
VTLVTDALGWGPLYELRFPGGWVWSNRPAAACRFGGVRAVADVTGWRTFAAAGWFMGDSTPFEHVYAIGAGTQIEYDALRHGRSGRRVDTVAGWAANARGGALHADRVDEVAEALRAHALSLSKARAGGMELWLSGGRDSRVVASAFLSAGVDVRLYTNGAEEGEATVASRLVAALPSRVAHRVDHSVIPSREGQGSPREDMTTIDRALGWHRCREGARMASFLPSPPPDGFRYEDEIVIGGDGGEIARGVYYPPDLADRTALPDRDQIDWSMRSMVRKVVRSSGISERARDATMWQLRRDALAAAALGLDGPMILDYCYVAERVRRRQSMAERHDLVSPLVIPEFVRASFDLTPEQHQTDALHTALIERLMPAWTALPYYERPPAMIQPVWQARLGIALEHALISGLVADQDPWADAFDVAIVQQEWMRLRTGEARRRAEQLLQRVIWRAVFEDYLAELNGEDPPERGAVGSVSTRFHRSRARRFTARALRKAARVVEPA